ncbi:MAG: efflux RND transporter periplasmic adaptor subunit [Gemmatimonadetes bacterium]|nr:efflux RND transporter periplasmic adaptor subunit [Gemmatimonadota bacterium]MYC16134.1 efflux RND transporter periplasmic adaptor subunit [Gemmatimonadota bacterium]MYK53555.1 efflux RND transporter periplasmic adaptor subunit [Gemmatimonadota bacterium]
MVHQSLATMIYNAMFLCGLFLMLVAARVNAEELILRAPLVPVQSATVYAGMNARMQQVNFEVGDRVVKGDTLMVLSRRDLRVKEAAARIALKKAQTLKARLEVLHDKNLVSDQQLENVRFDAEVAHYNWVAARMELDRTAIIAPQDGMVVEVNVKAGDWILAYTAVARVIDPEDLQVHLFVSEKRLNAIRMNMPLSAVPTAGGKRALPGRVIGISPVIDPENGTCKVTGLFLNAGKHVRPGALVNVTIGR